MFGIFIALLCGGLLIIIVRSIQEPEDRNPVLLVLSIGYCLRLLIRTFNREIAIFSDGQTLGGADAATYEERASGVAQLWQMTGVHFVTTEEMPTLNQVPLPSNLFAFIEYWNDGYSAIGCVSVIAFLACLTAFILYRTYIKYDSERKVSFYAMCLLFLGPSFVTLTSDSFKDGILVFLVVSIFSILVSINRQNFWRMLILLALCLWSLDGTRYYLIYALSIPIIIRLVGFQGQKIINLGSAFMLIFGLFLVGANLTLMYSYLDDAADLFENSYSYGSQISNLGGGSSVDIDGGRPTIESLPIKIVYTLFAPFPWQAGSLGLHLSKIEMLFWYYILYWTWRGILIFLRRDPMMVVMFSAFILGMIVVYSWSFTNIGLMYRQRLPIFFVASILAVWGRVAARTKA